MYTQIKIANLVGYRCTGDVKRSLVIMSDKKKIADVGDSWKIKVAKKSNENLDLKRSLALARRHTLI